jgi:methionyl-tRNA synthetase
MYDELGTTYRFDRYLELVWTIIQGLDQAIAETEPFKVVKTDPKKGREMIQELVDGLYSVTLQLRPIMPETSAKIEEAILQNRKPENLFPRKE